MTAKDKTNKQALIKDRKIDELSLLLETADLLNCELNPGLLLQKIAEQAIKIVDAKTVIIPVLNKECTEYCYQAGAGKYVDEIIGECLPVDFGICGWVWRNKRAWWHGLLNEMTDEEKQRWSATAQSMILVPMIGKKHFLGGIAAEYKQDGKAFNENDLNLLGLFASQAAIALENAQLHEELQNVNIRLEERVQQRTEELQQSNQRLEAFNHAISHDLKAPLRSIIGFSQALHEDFSKQIPADAQDYINRICKAGGRMNNLIDTLLDFSRFAHATMSINTSNISTLANDVIKELQEQSNIKNYNIDIEENLTASFDLTLMRCVLNNLLGNAIKFSSKQTSPNISFGLHEKKDSKQTFYVKDNGAGFNILHAKDMFNPFKRLHNPKDFQGTGIGLAIVDSIIKRHKGSVWAESNPGEGAVFYFSLPLSSSIKTEK